MKIELNRDFVFASNISSKYAHETLIEAQEKYGEVVDFYLKAVSTNKDDLWDLLGAIKVIQRDFHSKDSCIVVDEEKLEN